jgi:hypothetical protein
VDGDAGALLGGPDGDLGAETGAGAGDQDGAPLEAAGDGSSRMVFRHGILLSWITFNKRKLLSREQASI